MQRRAAAAPGSHPNTEMMQAVNKSESNGPVRSHEVQSPTVQCTCNIEHVSR